MTGERTVISWGPGRSSRPEVPLCSLNGCPTAMSGADETGKRISNTAPTLTQVTGTKHRFICLVAYKPLKIFFPEPFRQHFESEQAPENELSVMHIFHSFDSMPGAHSYGNALQDLRLSERVLAEENGIVQLPSDRDKIKGRAGTRHSNTRDSHGLQEREAIFSPLSVVELKGRNRLSNNLSLWVGLVENRVNLDEY